MKYLSKKSKLLLLAMQIKINIFKTNILWFKATNRFFDYKEFVTLIPLLTKHNSYLESRYNANRKVYFKLYILQYVYATL